MIRPLEYCENSSHLRESMETIDHRIAELQHLKTQYMAKAEKMKLASQTEFVNLPTDTADLNQLLEEPQLTENGKY